MIIVINCGHTLKGSGSGAIGLINESEETRTIGKKVISLLKENGHTVINATVDKASSQKVYLENVVDISNGYNADLFLSIHFDALNGKAQGSSIYTYKGSKHIEAVRILEKLEKIGFKNRGVKNGSELYVVRNTTAKALLIEVCFCDNKNDVNIYKANIGKIAKAIVEGVTGEMVEEKCSNSAFEESRKRLIEKGITDGTNPKGNVTREQCWSMIDRALKSIAK